MTDPELVPVEERSAVLAVSGLDPSGGAGLLVDATVIRGFGLHPLTVQTGVAVQNTTRFASRHDASPELLREQLAVLGEEFLLGAVKTGMLGTARIVEALSEWLTERPRLPLVVDPVLRATSGGELSDLAARAVVVQRLLPRARVVTPNLAEAASLSGRTVERRDDVEGAAVAILGLGVEWVLIKGGHLPKGRASDFLAGPDTRLWIEETRRDDRVVRGTGCALASGIAAGLAHGESVPDAVRGAKRFVTLAIDAAYVSGRGRFLRLLPRPSEN